LSEAPTAAELPLWLNAADPRKPHVIMIRRTKKRERFVPRDMKNPSAAKPHQIAETKVSITLTASRAYMHFVPYNEALVLLL
jgi:hypothetical protein